MKSRKFKIIVLAVFATILFSTRVVAQVQYDFIIKQVTLFDGSGKQPMVTDVAIAGDTIAYVGEIKHKYKAGKVIDGKKLYLSPGFIDPHTHYYSYLTQKDSTARMLPRALMQGVTTVFVGNDGDGPLPIKTAKVKLENAGIGPNVAFLVGHNSVRRSVLGEKDVQPNATQMNEMEHKVETAMKEGAFGISTGLFYTPGNYAQTEEVIKLGKIAAKYGGIYDTHQRDEGSQSIGIIKSTKEVLNIGYKANIPVHFSHIKIAGPPAWAKRDSVVYLIEKAQKDGVVVTANQYPYVASQTSLIAAVIPTWARDGGVKALRERFQDPKLRDSILRGIDLMIAARSGTADKIILSTKKNQEINSKSIQQIAQTWNLTPAEAVIRIAEKESPSVHSFTMREEDLEFFMKKPWVMTGSDGGGGHPRSHGAFARFIEEYALKRKLFPLAEAIYKSSYLTAKTFNIAKRGLIKPGFYADLFLFDPSTYKANASYENGEELSSGVHYLWVNGKLSIDNQTILHPLSGKALNR